MPIIRDMARKLLTPQGVGLSSIKLQPGSFTQPGGFTHARGGLRERRMSVAFPTANAPQLIYHGLGFAPTGYTVLGIAKANTSSYAAPGKIYNDFPLPTTSRTIVLKCDTANTIADILVR